MDKFHPDSYLIEKTGVKIETDDSELRFLIERAEDICEKNKASFCGIPVLREGAKYDGVWLETQPMGGEMYASRDAVTALGNHLIFMKYQRRDGKMPGMISVSYPFKGVTPHHDWMQGDFFSPSALRMYYLIGRDKKYLSLLYTAIKEFDEYLWEFRDTDGDGCLETFCTWDTGDDNNTRLLTHGIGAHEHGCARSEKAPEKTGDMPFESAEYMAYSYSQRSTLAKISDILENGEGDIWRERAEAVRRRFCEYLWDKDTAAAYDRDKNNETMYTLSLENIKCMYHGIFTQKMADEFISRHLMNPEEFFTPLPLPNIAANDPCFFLDEKRNNLTEDMLNTVLSVCASDISNNSWSGPAQGLCHQRVIDALLGYGHHAELSIIGRKWIDNIKRRKIFAQQYNPFTGECEEGKDGYGPTVLSALEYIAHLIGIDYASERFTFSSGVAEADSIYTQKIFGNTYALSRKSGQAILTKNGEEIFTFTRGVRIITNEALDILEVVGMESEPQEVVLTVADKEYKATVGPNEVFAIEDGSFKLIRKVPFSNCNRA